jgi:FMN phosphatase YigB (HAD superfamily)
VTPALGRDERPQVGAKRRVPDHRSVEPPAVLLWDFGDTLVDERWMLRAPDACPTWPAAWSEVMAIHADDWNLGAVRWPEIRSVLADRTGMALEDVDAHARRCCRLLKFNDTAWRVATERLLPQALVTVNPDLFADYVVGEHDLAAVFDVVVMSWAEQTAHKPALCDTALDRLGFSGARSDALLIDNRLDLVKAWRDAGGSGYWFQSDEQFAHDLRQLLG